MAGSDVEFNILERILEGQVNPHRLELALLRTITENFSDARIIGYGGCGVVYKGVLRNGFVAVKKLFKTHTIDERMFDREVNSMMMVKHENIVQLLGYCSDTQGESIEFRGNRVISDVRERLLCFEYIENGSLKNYIKDELRGLKWHERFQIIKGICEGLHHIHKEKHILHMDLKPDNILLGDRLVPKITDFGLARLEDQTHTTSEQRLLSIGYCAPEYLEQGKISAKSDIYSLGCIILELVTGSKEDPDISKVLRKWRHRWNKSSEDTPLLWYQQVAKCLDLTQWCKKKKPTRRPDISDIRNELNALESWDGQIRYATVSTFYKIMTCVVDMLSIEPLEMHFPFAQTEPISCSIEMTNDTDDYFTFKIATTSTLPFSTQPDKGIIPPRSNLSVTVTLQAQNRAQLQNYYGEEFTVQSTRIDGIPSSMDVTEDMFNDVVDKIIDEVHLSIVFDMPPTPEEPQTDMDHLEYQEADNAPGEPHSGESSQVLEEPWKSISPDDPRYDDVDVLERILDGSNSPGKLKFSLLEFITQKFSPSRRISDPRRQHDASVADIYKGTLRNGGIVAVKKFYDYLEFQEHVVHQEIEMMMTVEHKNIVRFLGYCSRSEDQAVEMEGRIILAQERQRLLCFEYFSNGRLDNHLTDELRGHEWHTRYQIIEGICEALLYLHKEKHIIHMDLKPSNILLDDHMEPKVYNFSYSRRDDKSQTGSNRAYTQGYCAPEFIHDGKWSAKSDIYSLGPIIMELVTGKKYDDKAMSHALRRWKHRWNKSGKYTPLWAQQVSKCLELAQRCVSFSPIDRPFIWDIIRELHESDQVNLCLDDLEDMLGIEPLELHFPIELNEPLSLSVQLTNDTDNFMAFRIITEKYYSDVLMTAEPNTDVVPPRSRCAVTVTMLAPQKITWEEMIIEVQSTRVEEGVTAKEVTSAMFREEDGKVVDSVDLIVRFDEA